ncbi:MAG: tetratricopeptide repeat protein [Holosporaceae bacterium]|nr:tetratricopeptide repeat protein [Holosporaceae bacterium]
MKKIAYFMIFSVFIVVSVRGVDEDLSDSIRELTGRMEVLEKKIEEQDQKIVALENADQKKEEVSNKTPEEVLKIAKDKIEENNLSEARKMLNAFISKNPGNVYCGIMQFYIGNTYYLERDYKNAALEYMKGFKANPNGSKAAETLYKLALCFKNMKEKEKYILTLQKIAASYPGEFANKATNDLKKSKK